MGGLLLISSEKQIQVNGLLPVRIPRLLLSTYYPSHYNISSLYILCVSIHGCIKITRRFLCIIPGGITNKNANKMDQGVALTFTVNAICPNNFNIGFLDDTYFFVR